MRNLLKSERGSVMLEFCLVLPIYLLIFGGTFLLFDLSMARLHLQEANRNIAWIQDDRFDRQGLINQKLYEKVKEYYDIRNSLEENMSGELVWTYGELYAKYCEKKQEAEESKKSGKTAESPDLPWGISVSEFKENGVELNINQSWADKLGGLIGECLQNDFLKLHSGNMELEMKKVSATYIGAVGVSSVLFPTLGADGRQTVPLHQGQYVLTRAKYDEETLENQKNIETTKVNGEMLVVRRSAESEKRETAGDVNDLAPLGVDSKNILFRSWPSNGTLGDISVLLGVGL